MAELESQMAEDDKLKLLINDAHTKWHSEDADNYRLELGNFALGFLKSMDGTLSFLSDCLPRHLGPVTWLVSTFVKLLFMLFIKVGTLKHSKHMAFALG